jgi:ribosomal protein L7/L12
MLPVLLAVVAVVAAGVLLLLLTRRSGGAHDLVGSQLATAQGADTPALSGPDDAELRRQIEMLLRQRNKIQAIKLLREQRPMSLRDAKTEVERIEADIEIGTTAAPPPATYATKLPSPSHTDRPGGVAPDVLAQIRDLKNRNQLIQAIKIMRQHTGMSLRDAKDAVERM